MGPAIAPACGTSIHSEAEVSLRYADIRPGLQLGQEARTSGGDRLALQQGLRGFLGAFMSISYFRPSHHGDPNPVLVCLFLRAAPLLLAVPPVSSSLPGEAHYRRTWYPPRVSTCIGGYVLGINCCPPDLTPSPECLPRLLQQDLG